MESASKIATLILGRLPGKHTLMDLHKMITELQAERQRLDEAIQALERLSAGKLRRRGRPPRWLNEEIQRQADGSHEETPVKTKKA